MELKRKLINGFSANLAGQAINIFTQLVSVALYLKYWDIKLYGEWLLVIAFPAYLAVLDLGLSTVAANMMTMYVSSNKKLQALAVFQSTWAFLNISSILLLTVGIILLKFLPNFSLIDLNLISSSEITKIMLIQIVNIIISLQSGILQAGYRCDGGFAFGTWIINIFKITEIISISITLIIGGGPSLVAAVILFNSLICYLTSLICLQRKTPWLKLGLNKASVIHLKKMIIPGLSFTLIPISNMIKNQGMVTLIGVSLGAEMIVVFSTTRILFNGIHQIIGLINNTIWAEISVAFGNKNLFLVKQIHHISCKVSLWVTIILVSIIFFIGRIIIEKWTAGQVPFNELYFNIMLLDIFIYSLWFTSSVILVATNKHNTMANMLVITSLISLALSLCLVKQIGISAAAVGLLFSDIFMVYYVLKESLNIINTNPKEFLSYMVNLKLRNI